MYCPMLHRLTEIENCFSKITNKMKETSLLILIKYSVYQDVFARTIIKGVNKIIPLFRISDLILKRFIDRTRKLLYFVAYFQQSIKIQVNSRNHVTFPCFNQGLCKKSERIPFTN